MGANASMSIFSNIGMSAQASTGTTSAATNYGVSAQATSTTSGTNYGIYSTASNGLTNYAGYFNGDVTVTGFFSNPSDRKLKKDIQPMNSALLLINQLKPVTYNFDMNVNPALHLPKDLQYGFIAQELETVIPQLVSKQVLPMGSENPDIVITADGHTAGAAPKAPFEYKGVNYISLIPILTQGIKEQQAVITTLEQRNKMLEEQLKSLEERVKRLEK
jgi:hypothetical protein